MTAWNNSRHRNICRGSIWFLFEKALVQSKWHPIVLLFCFLIRPRLGDCKGDSSWSSWHGFRYGLFWQEKTLCQFWLFWCVYTTLVSATVQESLRVTTITKGNQKPIGNWLFGTYEGTSAGMQCLPLPKNGICIYKNGIWATFRPYIKKHRHAPHPLRPPPPHGC